MYEIDVNNGRKIRLSFGKKGLLVEHIDHNGNVDGRDRFPDGDIVMLLNWCAFQRNNGNPCLLF